jgi:1-acyl-sn-glycerol-3-phosphate acyltransferase
MPIALFPGGKEHAMHALTANLAVDSPGFMEKSISHARAFWYGLRPWWWKAYWRLHTSGIENLPRSGPMILCANHTSHLDAAAILAALPRRIALRTATAAALDVWGTRPLRHLAGRITTNCVLIERKAEFAKGLRVLEAVLEEGRPLILFPEGRRSVSGELVEFKPGAAMLSLRTGTPIVPVHIGGVFESLPRGAMWPDATEVHIRFGKPILPASYLEGIAGRRISRKDAYVELTDELRRAIDGLSRVK